MCERTAERTASDVFLTLWRYHATHAEATDASDFLLCAEAWEKIRKMEEKKAEQERALDAWLELALPPQSGKPDSSPQGAPEGEKSTPEGVENVRQDGVENVHPEGVENGPKKASPWDTYRTNCQSRLLCTRFSTEQIVKAGNGAFTTENVRAFADDMRVIGTVTIGAIMKALDALEDRG